MVGEASWPRLHCPTVSPPLAYRDEGESSRENDPWYGSAIIHWESISRYESFLRNKNKQHKISLGLISTVRLHNVFVTQHRNTLVSEITSSDFQQSFRVFILACYWWTVNKKLIGFGDKYYFKSIHLLPYVNIKKKCNSVKADVNRNFSEISSSVLDKK